MQTIIGDTDGARGRKSTGTTNATTNNTNTAHRKLEIIVIGGSLGGLCAGIALIRLGHNVTILERNASELLHNQGAGIVAGGDTLAYFKRYDRCQQPIAISSQRRMYFDLQGNVVHQVDMVQNMTSWDLSYYILRANFDGVQSAYCTTPSRQPTDGTASHLHGHTLTDLVPDHSRICVHFIREADKTTGTIRADLVVGADGPSSTVRELLCPGIARTYTGYCALRGTIPESTASPAAVAAFSERFAFFHGPGRQILAYLIPGASGTVVPGERLINFVYYSNFPADSNELKELMTDKDGVRHRITMPPGKMQPEVWERQRALAATYLPPQFAEIVRKTEKPFVQAVTDVISPTHTFLGDKVVLIGDALAGFRPHTVASTSQAAFDAMVLADWVDGKIGREEWTRETMGYARFMQRRGVEMGERSQFGKLPLEELIKDRDRASVPRQKEVYPDWVIGD